MSPKRTAGAALLLLALLAASAHAQSNHAAPWLRMGVGARAMAMGTAQTAAAEDATAAYWNPASLVTLHAYEASLMYSAGMKAERSFNFLSAAMRAKEIGVFGFSWVNAGITGIRRYDASQNFLGTMDVAQNAFQLSFGRTLTKGVAVGLSAKYLHEDLAANTGYGVDAGVLVRPYDELQFGAMVRDIAGNDGRDPVPFEARLGFAYSPVKPITFAADLIQVKDENTTAALGITYRTPINANTDFYLAVGHNDLAGGRGFTAGTGFGFETFAVQYAYVTEPEAFLDANHRLSVNFYLGERGLFASLFGTMHKPRTPCDKKSEEIIHRIVIEGNPTLKVQLEVLQPAQKDSIRTVWAAPGGVVSFPGVNFAINSAVISPEFARVLDGAAQLINEHPEIGLLEIQGHCDSTGNDAINIPLSHNRAGEVRDYLISRGVSASRLTAQGYGATRPIAPNETEQGRYQNRRIDIVRIR